MGRLAHSFDKAVHLVAEGRLTELRHSLQNRLSTRFREQTLAYGLRRDLAVPLEAPKAKIPIEIRPAQESDAPLLFPEDQSGLPPAERLELAWRRSHFEARIPTCYVAVDPRSGAPCYFQWLMGPDQNEFIRSLGLCPLLKPDEAILENAYTPVQYRGYGIMAAAMALIAERGTALGARYVYTYVGQDNIPSLKGCARAGFSPHLVRDRTTWGFGLFSTVSFRLLGEGEAGGTSVSATA